MELRFDSYLGSQPYLYAREIARRCGGLGDPPVDLEVVARALKLKIRHISRDGGFDPEVHKMLMNTPSCLDPKTNTIWVYRHMPVTRQRLCIPHEMIHFLNPCHQTASLDRDSIDDERFFNNNRQEQEAFQGASWLMFLLERFIHRIRDYDETRLANIEELAREHVISREATAIWYAHVHPGSCGFLVAEPANLAPRKGRTKRGGAELPLIMNGHRGRPRSKKSMLPARTYGSDWLKDDIRRPLQVKYAVLSRNFPKRFIRPGTLIPETSALWRVYSSGSRETCEIRASELGSSSPIRFYAECMPYDLNGERKVWALLWTPDKQLDLLPG